VVGRKELAVYALNNGNLMSKINRKKTIYGTNKIEI
jgi:hypothetical protein